MRRSGATMGLRALDVARFRCGHAPFQRQHGLCACHVAGFQRGHVQFRRHHVPFRHDHG
ncbi:MAG: hypothetical protein IT372_05165 [Polyangiaceae bacterium]|nr:hypothetical protein [Polyangiaceae bacterium]